MNEIPKTQLSLGEIRAIWTTNDDAASPSHLFPLPSPQEARERAFRRRGATTGRGSFRTEPTPAQRIAREDRETHRTVVGLPRPKSVKEPPRRE